MAKKVSKKVTQAEVEEMAKEQTLQQSPEKDPEAEIQSVEIKKANILAPTVEFDGNNLRSVGNGVWRYICEGKEPNEKTFHCHLARQYGVKENDVVLVVNNGKVKTLAV